MRCCVSLIGIFEQTVFPLLRCPHNAGDFLLNLVGIFGVVSTMLLSQRVTSNRFPSFASFGQVDIGGGRAVSSFHFGQTRTGLIAKSGLGRCYISGSARGQTWSACRLKAVG